MSAATRWVVVDDTSDDINYNGTWFADSGSQDSVGNFGPPYRSTMHGTNSSAALSLDFTGTAVRVYGSTQIRNNSGEIDPQWECFVDQVSIGSAKPFAYPENNWLFCSQGNLTDGRHAISLNATISTGRTFWFDRIEYVPSTSLSLSNKTIRVDNLDPELQFGPGWSSFGGVANGTQRSGSIFTFNFYGVSLSWYGFIPSELNGNSTTATWSVDERASQNFILRGHASGAVTLYNQKFFETAVYPVGSHRLTVTFGGSGQTTPLVLESLVIQNGSVPISITSSTTETKSTNSTAIIGGVTGGVAFLVLALLVFIFLRRRRNSRNELEDKDVEVSQTFGSAAPALSSYSNWGGSSPPPPPSPFTTTQSSTSQLHSPSPGYGTQSISNISDSVTTNQFLGYGGPFQQPRPAKFREAEAQAAAAAAASSPSFQSGQSAKTHQRPPSQTASDSHYSSVSGGPARLVHHTDSGVRLRTEPPQVPVIDIPPVYTPV